MVGPASENSGVVFESLGLILSSARCLISGPSPMVLLRCWSNWLLACASSTDADQAGEGSGRRGYDVEESQLHCEWL